MSNGPSMSKWHKFRELDGADQWLVVRCAFWLAVARLKLAFVPFRRLSEKQSAGQASNHEIRDPELLRRVRFAMDVAANHVPWRSDCFPQTLAARSLLQRFNIASTIHFGVDRVGSGSLEGHAWLTCGEIVVTGDVELDRYTEMHRINP